MPLQLLPTTSVQPEPPRPTTTSPRALSPTTAAELTECAVAWMALPPAESADTARPTPEFAAVNAALKLLALVSATERPVADAPAPVSASGRTGDVQPTVPSTATDAR